MKPWTKEFVTSLWASGGFDGIAELHNRELAQLKGKMNNNSEEAEHHNRENISADRRAPSLGVKGGPFLPSTIVENFDATKRPVLSPKEPPPTPDRYERRQFPPEQSSKT